jgi:hypothetical protein
MHPYRDMGAREANTPEDASLARCIRVTRIVIMSWALLRVVVAVIGHRLPVEGGVAALLVVLVAFRGGIARVR